MTAAPTGAAAGAKEHDVNHVKMVGPVVRGLDGQLADAVIEAERRLADQVGRQALRCIRCSACLNACPVYERVATFRVDTAGRTPHDIAAEVADERGVRPDRDRDEPRARARDRRDADARETRRGELPRGR